MNKQTFTLKTVDSRNDYAEVVIEPLVQGFGHTLGNSLRRTLLSSIKGAAISQVKIDEVRHQFATLRGMKEDIVEFILNVKQLRVKYDGDDPIEMRLSKTGPGEVKASDIEVPSGVEIINDDFVLANLSDSKSSLKVIFTVESGYGYSTAESRKTNTIGLIPLDTSFSPILRVKFDVRETRVGNRTDFDKLIMKVWTDGSVVVEDAIVEASKFLMSFYEQIINPVIIEEEPVDLVAPEIQEVMRLTVEELDLPTRIANALRKGGYKTVEDLSNAKKDEVAKVKNLGGKSVHIVMDKLEKKGVTLKD